MVVRNARGYNAVYNALMTFKTLPKNLLIALTGISENEFQKFLKRHLIYKLAGDHYALNPSVTPDNELETLAIFFVNYPATSNIMLIGNNPTTFIFTFQPKGKPAGLSKLAYISGSNYPLAKKLETPEISYLFFFLEKQEFAQYLPKGSKDCIIAYVDSITFNKEKQIDMISLAPCK